MFLWRIEKSQKSWKNSKTERRTIIFSCQILVDDTRVVDGVICGGL